MVRLLLIAQAAFLAGCVTARGPISGKSYAFYGPLADTNRQLFRNECREAFAEKHKGPSEVTAAIRDGRLLLGMNWEEVAAALRSFSEEGLPVLPHPQEITRTEYGETYWYPYWSTLGRLHFQGGRLTSWRVRVPRN